MKLPPESATEFEQLHTERAPQLERIAWAIVRDWPLAADAVQEAFSLLAERWGQLAPSSRVGWLIKSVQLIAHGLRRQQLRNAVLVQRYGQTRNLQRDIGGGQQQVHSAVDSQPLEQVEQWELLQQAIGELPDAQKTVLHMRLRDEQTFAEIAQELQVPLGTVLSRMRLALEKLRTLVR